MVLPISQNEKFKFVSRVEMLNNLVNVLSKEKHLVDAFEILVSLLENNAAGISSLEDDLLQIREGFVFLLVSSIQGLLNLG